MVKVNVKRFSKSNIEPKEINDEPIIEQQIEEPIIIKEKKARGRKPKTVAFVDEPPTEEIIVEPVEPVEEIIDDHIEFVKPDPNDFLNELSSTNYINPEDEVKINKESEKENIKREKELFKFQKELFKQEEKEKKAIKKQISADDDLYSDNPTEIMGKDKRILLTKVKQYKNLFSTELKSFKIKPNPTVADLKMYLDEMEIIVNTSNVDGFLTDSILQCIRLVEGVSSHTTKYNVSGLADMLKNNKEFNNLTKQLYIKYNCFDNVPVEYQMLLLVTTSAYICRNKNIKRNEIDKYLNEEIKV